MNHMRLYDEQKHHNVGCWGWRRSERPSPDGGVSLVWREYDCGQAG